MTTLMAWTFGWGEVIIILGVFLLLFGSSKLPKLARSLGSSMTEFKKGLRGEPDDDQPKLEGDGEGDEGDEPSASSRKAE